MSSFRLPLRVYVPKVCQDAIEAIYDTCKGQRATRLWTLDADLAAPFDKPDHSHLMSAIGLRPVCRAW